MVYTLRFFPLQNAVCFIILTYLVPVLFTLYTGCAKIKKKFQRQKVKHILLLFVNIWCHQDNSSLLVTSHMPVLWQTVIRLTHYSTETFINNFFIPTVNQTLILSISVTTFESAVFYFMIFAQLVHQPYLASHIAQCLTNTISLCLITMGSATQSLTPSHKEHYER